MFRFVCYIAAIVAVAGIAGAEPKVRAYAERDTVTAGRPFIIHVDASGSSISPPTFPEVDGLRVTRMAQQTSMTNIEVINGQSRMTSTQGFGYVVQATRPGPLTVPPISIQIDGQTLQTQPIQLTVNEAPPPAANQNVAPEPGTPAEPSQRPSQQRREPTWDDAIRVKSSVDKNEVYVGEPVMLTLSLMKLRANGLEVAPRGRELMPPSAEGFYAVMLEPTVSQKEEEFPYEVTEYREVLYPTVPGDLKIDSWQWQGEASLNVFNRRPFQLQTPPIPIKVLPLPERPANFNGAVGEFTIKAVALRTDTVQGVPVKMQVQVSGRGNPDAIGDPAVPKIENAYVSDPEKESKPIDYQGAYGVQKTFTYNVTPLQPGDVTFPPIAFCYFEPASKSYKTEKTDAIVLHVQSSGESQAHLVVSEEMQQPNEGKVNVIGEDILPPMADPAGLRPTRGAGVVWPVAVVMPPAAYLALALFMRRKRRFETDAGYARDYFAKSKGHKRLEKVLESTEPAEELFRALTDYIADKLNVRAEGMTSSDARQLLERRQVDAAVTDNVAKILRACERTRYASSPISADEAAALTQAAANAIDAMDIIWKDKKRVRTGREGGQ